MRITLALLCLIYGSTGFAAEICTVPWKDGFKNAVDSGMRFAIKLHSGKGACLAHDTAFLASASDSEAVSCDLSIFVGGKIKTGWEVRMVADTMLFEMLPQTLPERFPVLRISAKAGSTVRFVPKSIEVKGPKGCDSWLNAFSI